MFSSSKMVLAAAGTAEGTLQRPPFGMAFGARASMLLIGKTKRDFSIFKTNPSPISVRWLVLLCASKSAARFGY